MQIFQVGGSVRDRLLSLAYSDTDFVVVGATAEEMLEQGFKPVGKDFPVFLHPKTKQEYALARTEKKVSRGYHGFTFYTSPSVTLEEDLSRRDLTINAIAQDDAGQLIDPHHGVDDINNKVLRHVSDAFCEDPLRILRVARFTARFSRLGFSIAPETMSLMKHMVNSGEVNSLVSERVWKEMEKALLEPAPHMFFYVLRECGALKVLFPEIDNLFGVPQPEQWHPEIDTGVHTMMVLEQASKLCAENSSSLKKEEKLSVLFSALVHDLGKAITPKHQLPSHKMHEIKGVPLVKALCQRLKTPKYIKDIALLVTEYHLLYHRIAELKNSTVIKLFNQLDAFRRPDRVLIYQLACEADSRGRTGYEDIVPEQTPIFLNYFEQASKVSVNNILAKGFKNAEIAKQLFIHRCNSLSKIETQTGIS